MTKPILFTWHARKVMQSRAISPNEVFDLLRNWKNRWAAREHKGRPTPDRYVYQGDSIAVVVDEKDSEITVVTVLLKEQREWTDEDARNRGRSADRSPG